MFDTLYRAERRIRHASLAGNLATFAIIAVSVSIAMRALPQAWWVAAMFALTALSTLSTNRWSAAFIAHTEVLKVALRNRMRSRRRPITQVAMLYKPMPVDEAALDRLFRSYAPGRDYFTAYDFARLREGEGAASGELVRWSGRWRRARLLRDYADLVVEEDRRLVPAVSKEVLRQVLQNAQRIDFDREPHGSFGSCQ
jgi:hypothetical protein